MFVAALGIVALAVGAMVGDDFETEHIPGSPPVGWDQTWSTSAIPNQVNLITVESGVGVGGGQGLSNDVSQTLQFYLAVNTNGASGTELSLSADFQIAITGEADTNVPVNINGALIGVGVKTSPVWSEGPISGPTFCRRNGGTGVGLRIPEDPWVWPLAGEIPNASVGLPESGLEAGTSGWFNIRMDLTDNGSQWSWIATLSNQDGAVRITTPAQTLDSGLFPSGADHNRTNLSGRCSIGHHGHV